MTNLAIKDFLDGCYANHVRKLSRVITSFYDAKLAESGVGLSYPQLALLVAMKAYGDSRCTTFCQRTGYERTAFHRNMRVMERSGFIRICKERSRKDGFERTFLVSKNFFITDKGESAIEKGYRIWQLNHAKIRDKVLGAGYTDSEDLSSFRYTCNEFVTALQDMMGLKAIPELEQALR